MLSLSRALVFILIALQQSTLPTPLTSPTQVDPPPPPQAAGTTAIRPAPPETGGNAWAFDMKYPGRPAAAARDLPNTLVITKRGIEARATASSAGGGSGHKYAGVTDGTTLELRDLQGKFTLRGTALDGKTLHGTIITSAGETIGFMGTLGKTLWACGNHSPAHLATSLAVMQELTKTNNCSRWSRSGTEAIATW